MIEQEKFMYIKTLKDVLMNAKNKMTTDDFCGIGLIVYSDITNLPIFPLSSSSNILPASLEESIVEASRFSNTCHDGFHLISPNWKITHRNHFFSPPIPSDISTLIKKDNMGARYFSALLGSLMNEIICTGIISNNGKAEIFCDGIIY